MQGIIFIGIQGSGKSTFFKEQFFDTHLRISLDLLNTRNKERQILEKCLELQQRIVIDNTNPTRKDRARYMDKLKQRKYEVIAYYFDSKLKEAIHRNNQRTGKAKIPEIGIQATYSKLELPTFEEGFDEIHQVTIVNNQFLIKKIEL